MEVGNVDLVFKPMEWISSAKKRVKREKRRKKRFYRTLKSSWRSIKASGEKFSEVPREQRR